MRVNTNVSAVDAQRNLMLTGMSLAKSVEKLSSGLRINRAGDDAAGLSISEKLRAQIRGLAQAQRNAQDGISMIQTAEGALTEVHSMLQRMRELAVQASNDTLSDADRGQVNTELQQLRSEIDGISTRTQFNGKFLLTGSLVTALGGATAADLVVGDTLTTTATTMVDALDVASAQAGKTFTFTYNSTTDALTLTRSGDSVAQTLTLAGLAANERKVLDFSALGVKLTLQNGPAAKAADDLGTDLTAAANDTIVTAAGSASANFQIGANAADFISVAFASVSIASLVLTASLDNFNTTQSVANAQALITAADAAVGSVNSTRSTLGGVQNRLEHTIANVGVAHENLLASESRIRDADMAFEMVHFTKTQILQQAGTAILAQANQNPQSILSLLR